MSPASQNWKCDGLGPHCNGVVKFYGFDDETGKMLCAYCWERENLYWRRHDRWFKTDNGPQHDWATATIYPDY
jgi:hypothetical protein